MASKKYYGVAVGRQPGIYTQWFGESGAYVQVKGYPGARYKGFATQKEAETFVRGHGRAQTRTPRSAPSAGEKSDTKPDANSMQNSPKRQIIYTDGSSLGNPGPGGFGVVIAEPVGPVELSGGFRKTTNNRMELLACIVGLEYLSSPATVSLYSDSRYVVDGISKGWARNWRRRGWKKSNGERALNIDLWERLLRLCDLHDVQFVWVKGHAGNHGNERCDQLATSAAAGRSLPPDTGYESDFS